MTTLECVCVLVEYMQYGFMSGHHVYGERGFPNSQSILELAELDGDTAEKELRDYPKIAAFMKERGL